MAEQDNSLVTEFTASLAELERQAVELQSTINRTLQALAANGIQISVDLEQMVQDVTKNLGVTRSRSNKVITQLDQQRELVRTTALITSSLELEQVLDEVMDTVIHLTGAERAYLMLRDRHTDELRIRTARNWDRESLSESDTVFSSSIVNAAIEQREPIVTTNAADDTRFQGMKSVVQHGLRSVLCIPLSLRERIVGVLYADNRIEQGIFSNENIPLLTAFGTQAAIAIENARQFGRVKSDLKKVQSELQELKIQIDKHKVQQQVDEITDSDYFEKLSEAAREIRASRNARRGG
jgi:GAF domain-containing protein